MVKRIAVIIFLLFFAAGTAIAENSGKPESNGKGAIQSMYSWIGAWDTGHAKKAEPPVVAPEKPAKQVSRKGNNFLQSAYNGLTTLDKLCVNSADRFCKACDKKCCDACNMDCGGTCCSKCVPTDN